MLSRSRRKLYGGISIFIVISAVSLATIFTPFVKAEEAVYNWKDITIPGGKVKESRISPDGSKLIVLQEGATFNDRKLLLSTDGANWSSSTAPEGAMNLLTNMDGSKLAVKGKYGQNNIHVSTDGGNSWTTPAAPVESDA